MQLLSVAVDRVPAAQLDLGLQNRQVFGLEAHIELLARHLSALEEALDLAHGARQARRQQGPLPELQVPTLVVLQLEPQPRPIGNHGSPLV